jgi:DNA transposition AAA+ family ATPase
MIEVHTETRVVKFATLSTAVSYLEDARRQVRKANDVLGKVYIVDTGAKANYTAPHPNDPRKAAVFVRAGAK